MKLLLRNAISVYRTIIEEVVPRAVLIGSAALERERMVVLSMDAPSKPRSIPVSYDGWFGHFFLFENGEHHPVSGARPERFHLIAPYEPDPRRWTTREWIDRYSTKTYRIATTGDHGSRTMARAKMYRDVVEEYAFHPEIKCADMQGQPCGKQTLGLLQRRHLRIADITAIGKESNSLEEVEAGLVHDEENVYTTYPDPHRSEWATKILPAVKSAPLAMLEAACRGRLSRRALSDIRAGRSTPHRKNQEFLAAIVLKLGDR
jgi:hypothetical protein